MPFSFPPSSSPLPLVEVLIFFLKQDLCSPGWPWAGYICLYVTEANLPASASGVQRRQMSTTMPGFSREPTLMMAFGPSEQPWTALAVLLILAYSLCPGKLPPLKVTVTPRISSDTFRSIWKLSKKSNRTRKKKKKVKSSASAQLSSSHQGAQDEAWASVEINGAFDPRV